MRACVRMCVCACVCVRAPLNWMMDEFVRGSVSAGEEIGLDDIVTK